MADKTSIEWTRSADGSPGATWNPVTGCSVVSPGCQRCYAMKLAGGRLKNHPSRSGLTKPGKNGPVWNGKISLNEEWLDQPLRWARPRMIFVCAHADLFYEAVPDTWIDRVFAVMALAPNHTFQVLTKRAERMRAYCSNPDVMRRVYSLACDMAVEARVNVTLIARPAHEKHAPPGPRVRLWTWPLPNVWLGVSAEDQQRADERIPYLLATPAAVRWVSAEPSLGASDYTRITPREGDTRTINALTGEVWYPGAGSISSQTVRGPRLDWVVVGGESGPGARPMHPDWVRSLRDQCEAAGVEFHFKQWGEFAPVEISFQEWRAPRPEHHGELAVAPNGHLTSRVGADLDPLHVMRRVGKARAGRLLDGREHNGMPGGTP